MLAGMSSGADFHFVHVLPLEDEVSKSSAHRWMTAATTPLKDVGVRASCSVLAGDRLDVLIRLAAAQRSDLLLLGHRQARSGRRSLARRLAMSAPCSVWLVPEGSAPRVGRLLAPIDFSPRSADALQIATRVAAAAGLPELDALHVRFNSAAVGYQEYEEIEISGEHEAFALFVARLDLHDVHVKPVFEQAPDIAATIRRVATERRCDLIVMGTRGRSRAASVLLGSETEQTLIHTRIPLLAVKRHGARLRLVHALLEQRLRDRGDLRYS
jgi:nucleotide-binding universal stress UspA family protein